MKRFLALVFFLWSSVAFAQTPSPVVPGFQVCNNKLGVTNCGWLGFAGSQASVPISVSTATTTKLVSGIPNLTTYIASVSIQAGGSGNAQLVAGTGTNCGSNTTNLTGAYVLSATTPPLVLGTGAGAVLVPPQGYDVCLTTSAAVQMSGSLSYSQF